MRRFSVAVCATLVMSVSYMDRQVLAAVAVSVREALQLSHEKYGWLQSAFSFAYLLATPVAGLAIDRVGARRGLTWALLVWSAVAAAHALAPSFAVLLALRVALGVAEAPSFPGAAQAVRRALPAADQPAGIGLLFTGSSIGAMVAGPLAIALEGRFGSYRAAFVGAALVGLAWIPLWLLATRTIDVRRALAPAARAEGAGVAIAGELLRTPAVQRAMVMVVGSAPAIMFVLLWTPQYLRATFGVTQEGLKQFLWLPPLFFDAGALAFGLWGTRRVRRAGDGAVRSFGDMIVLAAVLESATGLACLARTPWAAVALLSVGLAGGGALFARLTADMLARVPPERAAAAGGLTAAAQSLAYIVANPLVGATIDRTHSYAGALVGVSVLVLPAAAAWVMWPVDGARGAAHGG